MKRRLVLWWRRLRWPVKCCRCWPASVNAKGYCRCCDYDHPTGVRHDVADPDYGL